MKAISPRHHGGHEVGTIVAVFRLTDICSEVWNGDVGEASPSFIGCIQGEDISIPAGIVVGIKICNPQHYFLLQVVVIVVVILLFVIVIIIIDY